MKNSHLEVVVPAIILIAVLVGFWARGLVSTFGSACVECVPEERLDDFSFETQIDLKCEEHVYEVFEKHTRCLSELFETHLALSRLRVLYSEDTEALEREVERCRRDW